MFSSSFQTGQFSINSKTRTFFRLGVSVASLETGFVTCILANSCRPDAAYVFGSSISSIPTGLLDALVYGSLVYFLVGLAINDGASIVNYIIFVLVLFVVSWTTGLFFSVYATCIESVTTTQAAMAGELIGRTLYIWFSQLIKYFCFQNPSHYCLLYFIQRVYSTAQRHPKLLYMDLLGELFLLDVSRWVCTSLLPTCFLHLI